MNVAKLMRRVSVATPEAPDHNTLWSTSENDPSIGRNPSMLGMIPSKYEDAW